MTVIHLRRGRCGVLRGDDAVLGESGVHQLDALGSLPGLLRTLR